MKKPKSTQWRAKINSDKQFKYQINQKMKAILSSIKI